MVFYVGFYVWSFVSDKSKTRFWEIDILRSIAIIEMIIYHILFDLDFLGIVDLPLREWWMMIFLYSIGGLFLLLVGVSLSIGGMRLDQKFGVKKRLIWGVRRGFFLLVVGFGVSLATWLWAPGCFVKFGVLHCIGLCLILGIFLVGRKKLCALLTGLFIGLGFVVDSFTVSSRLFFWLGLRYPGFCSLDFFPLLPWFGVVCLGLFLGALLYPGGKRGFTLNVHPSNKFFSFFCWLGRNSLWIYVIHQPVIVGILLLAKTL